MSNKKQSENKYQEYQDYKFCKAVECSYLNRVPCCCLIEHCNYSAKEFHEWLNSNGYRIVKREQNESQNPFKTMRIVTTVGVVTLIGRYRRDLEKTNWHYYETNKGDLLHFRKDFMVAVLEDERESFTTFVDSNDSK